MFEQAQEKNVTNSAARGSVIPFGPIAQIDFAKFADVLRRQAKFIGAVTAGSLLAMVAFILLVTPQYTAVTEILINPSDLRAVDNGLTNNNQLTDANVIQVESQVRVLTSDSVLRRVVASEHLESDPEFSAGASPIRKLLATTLAAFGIEAAKQTDRTLEALTELRKRVGVRRAERTYVVDVSVATREAEKSVRIANQIAQAYLAEQTSASSEAARRVSDSISSRLAELKVRVRVAEERVEQFKSRNNIVDSQGQLVNERQLTELNVHLMQARARTAEAKSRFDLVRNLHNGSIETGAMPEAIQSQSVTALRAQYAIAIRQESEQKAMLGEKHPALYETRAQVESLRRLLREEVGRVADALRNDYERAKSNEESLDRSVNALKHDAVSTKEQLVPLRELEREVQTSRAVYESFLTRARETGEQERLDTKNIRIISLADLPQRRSWPPRNAFLLLGALFLGVGAGTGLAFLRDAPPTAPREIKTIAQAGELPLLAILPPRSAARELEALARPQSPFATEIRALEQALRAGKPPRNILIVATRDDDDAAAVALNLAAVAASRQRVLLIDADPRRRAIARLIPFAPSAGLAEVAAGSIPLAAAVKHDERSGISIVALSAKGRERERPGLAEINASLEAATPYDLVIVAASARSGDDLGLLANFADKIVIIVDAGGVHDGDADAFGLLDGKEDRIAGVVVANASSPAQSTAA